VLIASLIACVHAQPSATSSQPAPAPPPDAAPAPAPGNPAWIGVLFAPESTVAEQVLAGGPAHKAGIVAGDQIVVVDGVDVTQPAEVTNLVRTRAPGQRVAVQVVRSGKRRDVAIVVEERPDTRTWIDRALVGQRAPDFAATNIRGGATRLAELAGHVVLLDFWATWCMPCHAAMPSLVQWHQKYSGRGLRIVGVSQESRDVLEAFLRDQPLPYAIGQDSGDAMWRAYLVRGVPTTVLIDRGGVIRHVELGLGDLDKTEAMIERLLAP
jgi:cytochrome c biogenesis protein CcmG, thiol:disulfide interchange protein DsbE